MTVNNNKNIEIGNDTFDGDENLDKNGYNEESIYLKNKM